MIIYKIPPTATKPNIVVSLLQPYLPDATIRSSECSDTGEFIPIFSDKLFREPLRVQN